jgi:hypothetical protein
VRPSRRAGEEFANWHRDRLGIVIEGFLAVDAKGGSWHCREALRMDVLLAPPTYPEAPILNSAESRTGIPELSAITVEIANRERAFRGPLHFFHRFRGSLNRDPLALAGDPLQFGDSCR